MASYFQEFTIFLTDADECAAAQAAYPDGILDAPNTVAATYGIAVPLVSSYEGDAIWAYGGGTGTSGLTNAVASIAIASGFVLDSFNNLVAFTGAPGGTLFWRGRFLRRGAAGPATKEALQTHRWMVGFERANNGDQVTGGAAVQRINRDASRTLEGMGLALRSPAAEVVTMTMPSTGTGFPARYSWERLYVRLRAYPTANEMIWGCKGGGQAGTAGLLSVTPQGLLQFYNKGNQAFPGTAAGSPVGPLGLNQWVKLDMIFGFGLLASGGSGDGFIGVYINGALSIHVFGNGPVGPTVGGAGGLFNIVQTHLSSAVGNENTPSTGLEIDYDDWTNKTQPQLYTGDDWIFGTHIQPLRVTGFDTGHDAAWGGAYQTLDGTPVIGQAAADELSTSTASLSIAATTDFKDKHAGCSGLQLSMFHRSSGGTSEQLGYSINGAAAVMQAVVTSTGAWSVPAATTMAQILYSAGGNLTAPALTTVGLKYTRDALGTLRAVNLLYGAAEYMGIWGDEDLINLDNPSELPPRQGPHNSPYYDQGFGQTAVQFGMGQVEVMAGTYTGNGTGQDITLSFPGHWIWIRPLTLGTGGARWFSSMLAGHGPLIETAEKGMLVRAFQTVNDSGVPSSYKFSVSGTAANSNNTGVEYQYVAFSDRAMRFLLNGSYLTLSATASFTHSLYNPSFTPLGGFLLPELGTLAATTGMYYKGPGHATNAASIMDSAESATVCAFNAGSLTPKTILNLASSQTAYSLWRSTDGDSIASGIAITNYTGDGLGARVIPLSLNGRRPMFAIVQPHNGVAYQRDPSHTGSNSNAINSSAAAPSTTAITAGDVDQITVGATLNAGAVVYDVFVIPAQVGGTGWGTNPPAPIPLVDPIPPADENLPPASMNGWWTSAIKFTGAATITSFPPTNPHDARDWQKINLFATGNAGFNGGFPGPGCNVNNFLIYAGNDYSVGGTQPTIRIFDGLSDRLMITVPDVAGVKTIAIIAMLAVGDIIYFTTLDSGTSASDWAGRVFAFNTTTLTLKLLGTQFTSGAVPYALAWHMGRLWMGTNKGTGAVGTVNWFRPDTDTAWTTDYTLSSSSVGGVQSMASYQGKLYVGANATAAMGTNKLLVRDSLGAWSTSFTATVAGTFRASNGFPAMVVFNDKLYASYWNPDTTADSYIKRFDGASWATVYTGAGVTLRPFIALFESQKTLFALGGGSALSAALVSTPDGGTWTDLTAFLTGPTTSTALPIIGKIGA
jgi:hypothetical protein